MILSIVVVYCCCWNDESIRDFPPNCFCSVYLKIRNYLNWISKWSNLDCRSIPLFFLHSSFLSVCLHLLLSFFGLNWRRPNWSIEIREIAVCLQDQWWIKSNIPVGRNLSTFRRGKAGYLDAAATLFNYLRFNFGNDNFTRRPFCCCCSCSSPKAFFFLLTSTSCSSCYYLYVGR